jgi:hypothetical protein
LLGRITSHTVEDKTQEKNKPEDISKWQPYDKGHLAKFLSSFLKFRFMQGRHFFNIYTIRV